MESGSRFTKFLKFKDDLKVENFTARKSIFKS